MKKDRFTEEQMVTILREADSSPVAEVAKKHGVSEQTIYGWRKRFGKLEPADVKRLRQLEQENAKLKKHGRRARSGDRRRSRRSPQKMVAAGAARTRSPMRDGRAACRTASACELLAVARSTLRIRVAAAPNAMRRRSRRCGRSPRSIRATGIGASGSSCDREGIVMSCRSRVSALARRGLQLPTKRPRRRVATTARGPLPPTGANHVWAYDFVFDACANGQQLKCLTVIDEFTRECLAIDVAGSIRSAPRDRGARRSSSACTARRATCAPTTAPSSSHERSWMARRRRRSRPRSSIRASRGRTATTNPSTASSATSV